jgi:hypothetical protein
VHDRASLPNHLTLLPVLSQRKQNFLIWWENKGEPYISSSSPSSLAIREEAINIEEMVCKFSM